MVEDGGYVVPTPAEFFGTGETLAFPYLNFGMTESGVSIAATVDVLAFDVEEDTYSGRGIVGADNAVYFLPKDKRPVMRLDPATGDITFVALPGDASDQTTFVNGALHPASGHIIAAPTYGTGGRIMAIDTSGSPTTSWIEGSTDVHTNVSFFGELAMFTTITDPSGVLLLIDLDNEQDTGLSAGIAWNPSTGLFVLAPGSYLGDVIILDYAAGGASKAKRFPMQTDIRGFLFEPYTNAIYNPVRGTVVLLPADAINLTEVDYRSEAFQPIERVLFNFGFPWGPKIHGAVVFGQRLFCFPFMVLSNRVLELDAARDPDSTNIISFYGY